MGTSISDVASLTLTWGDGSPYGSVVFALWAGTCSSQTGSAIFTSTITVSGSTSYSGAYSTTSGSFSTTGLSAGSYVWLVYYTGTGTGGYPRAPTSGYDCEPITLTVSHGVPEFSAGLPLLLALAAPALLLLRRQRLATAV